MPPGRKPRSAPSSTTVARRSRPATCLGQIAAAIYWGPTAVSPGIERCMELLGDETIGLRRPRGGRSRISVGCTPRPADFSTRPRAHRRGRAHLRRARLRLRRWSTAAPCELTSSCSPPTLPPPSERSASSASTSNARMTERTWPSGRPSSPRRSTGKGASTRPSTGPTCRGANAASDDQSAQLILGSVEAKLLASAEATRRGSRARARRPCGSPTAPTA